MKALRIFGMILTAILGGNFWWRWSSRHRTLPCPTCLAWGLGNPLMDRLIGRQTILDRIGLRPGRRVLVMGPGQADF